MVQDNNRPEAKSENVPGEQGPSIKSKGNLIYFQGLVLSFALWFFLQSAYALYFKFFFFSLLNITFSLAFCLLLTNKTRLKENHIIYRTLFILLVNSLTLVLELSFKGPSKYGQGFLLFPLFSFIIFESQEWRHRLWTFFLPIILYFIISHNNFNDWPLLGRPDYNFNLLNSFSTCVLFLFFPLYIISSYEKSEVHLNKLIHERTTELLEEKENLEKKVQARTVLLQESMARFQRITECMKEVFWMSTPDGTNLYYVSPGIEEIWGYLRSDFENQPSLWRKSIHPNDLETVTKAFSRLKEGITFNVQYRIIRSDGTVRWIWDQANCIFGDNGQAIQVCGVASDITEQKLNEIRLAEQQAKILATAKLTALGEMAGGIAHEINNPLSIIHAKAGQLIELSEEGEIPSQTVREFASKIELTATRISKIINSLRHVSRDSEKDPFETVTLSHLIEDLLELCKERFKNSGIDLIISPFDQKIQLESRGHQILQVLLNLFNNAFDAVGNQGEKWIKLDILNNQGILTFMVTDSGKGIPHGLRDKIFQPFFTSKPVGKGTGLGLSISKNIIDNHKGTLQIDPSCHHTRFILTLPIKQGQKA